MAEFTEDPTQMLEETGQNFDKLFSNEWFMVAGLKVDAGGAVLVQVGRDPGRMDSLVVSRPPEEDDRAYRFNYKLYGPEDMSLWRGDKYSKPVPGEVRVNFDWQVGNPNARLKEVTAFVGNCIQVGRLNTAEGVGKVTGFVRDHYNDIDFKGACRSFVQVKPVS